MDTWLVLFKFVECMLCGGKDMLSTFYYKLNFYPEITVKLI